MTLGIGQLIVVLVLVLILFGAGRLPQVMSDLGKGLKSFREGMKENKDDDRKNKKK